MKYKFKKFWAEWRDTVFVGIIILLLLSIWMMPFWANHNAEKNNPMDSTTEKGIRAKSFEYKGHKYILFEEKSVFGHISVVHDPDCCK